VSREVKDYKFESADLFALLQKILRTAQLKVSIKAVVNEKLLGVEPDKNETKMSKKLQQTIVAEKIKQILTPYAGSYLSNKEVARITRTLALALTGDDESPEPMQVRLEGNKILEKEVEKEK
tara:strand:+ start:1093 stop:1458 length:366 start_codon:yes stop_codon:yes gene_type:complete